MSNKIALIIMALIELIAWSLRNDILIYLKHD